MKVNNRRALYEALTILVRVADYKSTIPALRCVKLIATNDVLTVVATNLEQTLTAEIPCEGDLTCCLPAKALAQLAKPEPRTSGDLDIELIDESVVAIKAEGVVVRLMSFPVEDFPADNTDDFNLVAMWPAKPFADSLAFCTPAVCTDETRPHICYISLDEVMAATDGHHLHTAPLPAQLSEPLLLRVPDAKLLLHLLKEGEQVIIAKSKERLRMKVGSLLLETKLVDSEFPPYDHVIPRRYDTKIVVDAGQFAKAVKRLGSLSNARTRGIRMTINGAVEMSSEDPDVGDVTVVVEPLENNHDGEDTIVGLNGAFLLDALRKEKGNVTISMSGSLDPVRLDLEGSRMSLIMPMRI